MSSIFHSIQCHVSPEVYRKVKIKAATLGFRGVSAYVLSLIAKDNPDIRAELEP